MFKKWEWNKFALIIHPEAVKTIIRSVLWHGWCSLTGGTWDLAGLYFDLIRQSLGVLLCSSEQWTNCTKQTQRLPNWWIELMINWLNTVIAWVLLLGAEIGSPLTLVWKMMYWSNLSRLFITWNTTMFQEWILWVSQRTFIFISDNRVCQRLLI